MKIPPFSARRLQLAAMLGPVLFPLLGPGLAAAADGQARVDGPVAGELVLSAGPVFLVTAEGEQPLLRGQSLHAGSTLVTGEGGFAHIRMTDGGVVAIRPLSRFEIEVFDYQHDADKDRVRYRLEQGVARSITGMVGERNKEAFRLNTPVAAVGVRGTDFVVSTNQVASRVALNSGAVVVAALGDTCQANGFGACTDAGVMLGENLGAPSQYVEVLQGERMPRVVQDVVFAPDTISPPHADEPAGATLRPGGASSMRLDDAQASETPVSIATETLPEKPEGPTAPIIEPTPEPWRPEIDAYWGRWRTAQSVDGTSLAAVAGILNGDNPLHVTNSVYAAGVGRLIASVPTEGQLAFRSVGGEGVMVNAAGLQQPLALQDGSLSVNFNTRSFSTEAAFSHGTTSYQTQAAGTISERGYLTYDPAQSLAKVYGALGPNGDTAVTVIEQAFSDGVLSGVVGWERR